MTACALPSGQCVTAYDLDGTTLSYCGDAGHDPGWASSALDSNQQKPKNRYATVADFLATLREAIVGDASTDGADDGGTMGYATTIYVDVRMEKDKILTKKWTRSMSWTTSPTSS